MLLVCCFYQKWKGLAAVSENLVMKTPWPTYDKGCVVLGDEEALAAQRVMSSRRLFRYDDRPFSMTEVGCFESELASFFSVRHALATSTGTSALALSLFGLGVGPGDEVLLSAFGFPATPSSVLLTGAKPVLFEIDDELHPDVHDLDRKCNSRTKAVIVVHMRGQAGNIEEIVRYCDQRGLPLIEDAVPALGAEHAGRYLGTFGRAGAFSTQSDKSLNTGEGGFVLTDDTALFEKMVALSGAYEGRFLRHCNWASTFDYNSLPLYNFRMDELRGAIARSQLGRLTERIQVLRQNYSRVSAIFDKYPEIRVRKSCDEGGTLGDSIVFRLNNADPSDALWFCDQLRMSGIECRYFGLIGPENVRTFWMWRFLFPEMTVEEIRATLPNTKDLLDRTIDIPLSPLLTEQNIVDLDSALEAAVSLWRQRAHNAIEA
ncbi:MULTISPECIES: DegT/DnrJ/EryC1/StrS aminotransferase family protein [unclassified Neorhizobium]|uniref:DegT/DnrJ/EryC1/StrS family aminotransferase n=1 Tax=unclassified Neorhizobium TaxID=2629175 RepID=UPI001FF1D476|nr:MULTISPECIES: aminotransferase class I/II-fold pyridoxal phosphate-dependent enzyme [unclassified Neorhizobium]MCJ9673271.1 aminotransferase class I/II-fold pyridoxal phosphate-dependent enzyme [Neorhizobium sp. SHOUNA12B]MCJ9748659.1 aminotransferase class I/II-fold pyridoxal phosphate-dependent enzyme [Neorhizobium sp. SHOUNA12A]